MKVVFVCSGNICRSPMAAEYLRRRAAGEGLGHLVVASAGTLDIEGERASPLAVQVLREAGLDLTGHRSRGVRDSDLRSADLVLAMELSHLELLERNFPGGHGKVKLLRAFEKGPEPELGAPDLSDPIGRPVEEYRDCFRTIRTCVDHLVLHLKHAP